MCYSPVPYILRLKNNIGTDLFYVKSAQNLIKSGIGYLHIPGLNEAEPLLGFLFHVLHPFF